MSRASSRKALAKAVGIFKPSLATAIMLEDAIRRGAEVGVDRVLHGSVWKGGTRLWVQLPKWVASVYPPRMWEDAGFEPMTYTRGSDSLSWMKLHVVP